MTELTIDFLKTLPAMTLGELEIFIGTLSEKQKIVPCHVIMCFEDADVVLLKQNTEPDEANPFSRN